MKTANNVKKPGDCQAYLVRLWRDSPQEPWRASVKLVFTNQEFHFASPEKLFLFLHEQTISDVVNDR